jgi:hypothetical protein
LSLRALKSAGSNLGASAGWVAELLLAQAARSMLAITKNASGLYIFDLLISSSFRKKKYSTTQPDEFAVQYPL